MTQLTLTILDTVSIQAYIFASNRLRENIGASYLVKQVTEQWPLEILPQPCNVRAGVIQPELKIEDRDTANPLQAEVVYVGGGNTLILFTDPSEARAFVTKLSCRLIEEAPGINLAATHYLFEWESQPLGGSNGIVAQTFLQLEEVKRGQVGSHPLAGLGVTATCQSTSEVAVTTNEAYKASGEATYAISSQVVAKLYNAPKANQELIRADGSGYKIPFNFDEMGRSEGESSYIAVVHADGNDMGKRVRLLAEEHDTADKNRSYIEAMRDLSDKLKKAGKNSLDAVHDLLLQSIRYVSDKEGKTVETIMEAVPIENGFIPYRPLVHGGDDFTFVCDGRLALTLTAFYLKTFETETAKVGLEETYACAGVAVVKTHYPFARAYHLAEALTKEAKQFAKEKCDKRMSAIDWHFAPGGLMGELEFIRAREYQIPDQGTLLMRPIALDKTATDDWRYWDNLQAAIKTFKQEQWREKQNKVKRLREALRGGPIPVRQFLTAYQERLPALKDTGAGVESSGWYNKRCCYYDAIEAAEFFVPLHDQGGVI